ncbi:hypothetical protein GF326_12430 [Candidatus Bathyarchaeota archaeon]|nr:hypothetical protein [Candidatus Bathyarchaeota archaeon]
MSATLPRINASIAVDVSPSTLINQAESIIIGKITTAEKTYDGYRLVVQVQSYLGEPPSKDILILSGSEGLFCEPKAGQSYVFLLVTRNNRLDIAVMGAGMYQLDNTPPEINKLLETQFSPIVSTYNSWTNVWIYSIIILVATGLITKQFKEVISQ